MSKFATFAALALLSGVASAHAPSFFGGPPPPPPPRAPAPHPGVPTAQAPEIDPASALAAMTLLAGGILLLRGRKTG
jgi:hypothetical protein